jgi:hypothetical protein
MEGEGNYFKARILKARRVHDAISEVAFMQFQSPAIQLMGFILGDYLVSRVGIM